MSINRNSLGSLWIAIQIFAEDFLKNRDIIFRIYERNHLHQYAGTFLGKAWLLISPCIPLLVYNSLQFMGVFGGSGDGIPKVVSLTLGLTVYYTFSELLQSLTSSLTSNKGYILNTGIPKIVIIISEIYSAITNLFIRMLALVATFAIYPEYLSFKLLLLPLVVVPLLVLAVSLGIVLSLFTVIYKDITNVVGIITFYLLFASGVFGRVEGDSYFYRILQLNPIHIVINDFRDFLFSSTVDLSRGEIISILFCIAIFPLSLVLFYRGEKYVNSYL